MIPDNYLNFLTNLTKLDVATHSIVALLMVKFPELGITGAMLIVEYWQDVRSQAKSGPEKEVNK